MSSLSVLTLNIANPSVERAQRQLEWLVSRDEDVFVLTETKASDGCRLLADAFQAGGYAVIFPEPGPGEYGTMIASKIRAEPDDWNQKLGYLPARAATTVLPAPGGNLHLIGLYVPSRDASLVKTDRKRRWFEACANALTTIGYPTRHILLLGDLNILEPDHQPRYNFFAPFEYDFYRALLDRHGLVDAFRQLHPDAREYSWVGRTGDGYRYDHAFCSVALAPNLLACDYLHEPRSTRLSDHSGLTVRLALEPPESLLTSGPASGPPTLF